MTIPGEGKDRIFKVSIRFLATVSWRLLQETLVSGRLQVPLDSVQALDVAMRHLASMRYGTLSTHVRVYTHTRTQADTHRQTQTGRRARKHAHYESKGREACG